MAKRKKRSHSALYSLLIILGLIVIASAILSMIGAGAEQSIIISGSIETSLITVRNILSLDGIKYFFSNTLNNLGLFEPILILIVALIGISIGESSGLFKAIFSPLMRLKPKYITFFILLISLIGGFFGEYSYVFILPVAGIIYKYLNRSSILGLMIAFLGLTIGFGTNVFVNYDVASLGGLTQLAAQADVDKSFLFNMNSMMFIMIASTLILSVVGTIIIERQLAHKIERQTRIEDELVYSKKAMLTSLVVFGFLMIIVLYAIIPGIPGGGFLLNKDASGYLNQLYSPGSPFRESFVLIVTLLITVCSIIYGTISKNLIGSHQYTEKIGDHFDQLGYAFVLLFTLSQIVGVIDWTNIGNVVLIWMTNILSQVELSGMLLIIATFFVTIIGSLLLPGTIAKWTIMSPIIVPLFMRANLTPSFSQFVFMASDGIGKAFSPVFPYFLILLGFMHKYGDDNISITKTYKKLWPTMALFMLLWLLIIISWYIIGLPMGPNIFPTS